MCSRITSPIAALLLSTVFCFQLSAADYVQPLPSAPRYQLSTPRKETDRFGRSVLVVEWRRTKEGKGSVHLTGHSENGSVMTSVFISPHEQSGRVHLSKFFSFRDSDYDVELFLVQSHRISGKKSLQALVSNTVRVGNPGAAVRARAWTASERKSWEEFRRIMADDSAHKPNKSYVVTVQPSDGFEFVPNTAKIKKGHRTTSLFSKQLAFGFRHFGK